MDDPILGTTSLDRFNARQAQADHPAMASVPAAWDPRNPAERTPAGRGKQWRFMMNVRNNSSRPVGLDRWLAWSASLITVHVAATHRWVALGLRRREEGKSCGRHMAWKVPRYSMALAELPLGGEMVCDLLFHQVKGTIASPVKWTVQSETASWEYPRATSPSQRSRIIEFGKHLDSSAVLRVWGDGRVREGRETAAPIGKDCFLEPCIGVDRMKESAPRRPGLSAGQ